MRFSPAHGVSAVPSAPEPAGRESPVAGVCTACAMAFATAALELLILGVRRWQGSFTGSGAEVVWMAPAGYLLLFGVPALVVSPLASRIPRLSIATHSAATLMGQMYDNRTVHDWRETCSPFDSLTHLGKRR